MRGVEQVSEADAATQSDVDEALRRMGYDPDEVRAASEAALQEALARVEAKKEQQLRALAFRQKMIRGARVASDGDDSW